MHMYLNLGTLPEGTLPHFFEFSANLSRHAGADLRVVPYPTAVGCKWESAVGPNEDPTTSSPEQEQRQPAAGGGGSQQEHSPNPREDTCRATLGENWEGRKSLWAVPPSSSEPGKKCQDREGEKISSHGFPPARLPKLAHSIHRAGTSVHSAVLHDGPFLPLFLCR